MLPTDNEINDAIKRLDSKYINNPEYLISPHVTWNRGLFSITIESTGPHHVSNSYDLGLALGEGTKVHYKKSKNGSLVKLTLF